MDTNTATLTTSITNTVRAIAWTVAGFTADDAADWQAEGLGPFEARAWRAVGFNQHEAGTWHGAGYVPIVHPLKGGCAALPRGRWPLLRGWLGLRP